MTHVPPPKTILVAVEELPDGSLVVRAPNEHIREARSPAELWGALFTMLRDPSVPPLSTQSAQTWEEALGTMAADMVGELVRRAAPTVVPAVHKAAARTRATAGEMVKTIQRSERPVPYGRTR